MNEADLETKLLEEIRVGERPLELLQDEGFAAWFQKCETDVWEQFLSAESDEQVLEAKRDHQALTRIWDKLKEAADTCKMAQQGLNELRSKQDKRRDRRTQLEADYDVTTNYDVVN